MEKKSKILDEFSLVPKEYYLVTIHRAENTDNPARLQNIIEALDSIDEKKPVVFPVHPRTRKVLRQQKRFRPPGVKFKFTDPVGYHDMLMLEKNSAVVLTDSGGVQREAFLLGVPCVILREESEWVELFEYRSMILGGSQRQSIARAMSMLNSSKELTKNTENQVLGDGKAAVRIVTLLAQWKTNRSITSSK